MKRSVLILTIILAALRLSAAVNNIDSLKQKLKLTTDDSLKAHVYTELAAQYLKFDSIQNRNEKVFYQESALSYTMQALHLYSKYNDSIGLRISFDALARVYRSQKKFSQAKWFILQSNTISRALNDNHNIVASLRELAAIKIDIKDYKLAMSDLNEALSLTINNYYPDQEADVQHDYAMLYNRLKLYDKADIAQKRHDFLVDSMHKDDEARLMSKLNAAYSADAKKKEPINSNSKIYRQNYSKRIASL